LQFAVQGGNPPLFLSSDYSLAAAERHRPAGAVHALSWLAAVFVVAVAGAGNHAGRSTTRDWNLTITLIRF